MSYRYTAALQTIAASAWIVILVAAFAGAPDAVGQVLIGATTAVMGALLGNGVYGLLEPWRSRRERNRALELAHAEDLQALGIKARDVERHWHEMTFTMPKLIFGDDVTPVGLEPMAAPESVAFYQMKDGRTLRYPVPASDEVAAEDAAS